jgi:hypothetical protein
MTSSTEWMIPAGSEYSEHVTAGGRSSARSQKLLTVRLRGVEDGKAGRRGSCTCADIRLHGAFVATFPLAQPVRRDSSLTPGMRQK